MFFSRKALGMEITPNGFKMVMVGGRRNMPKLLAQEVAEFPPGTIRLLHREPNVLLPDIFVRQVREAHLKLQHGSDLVSVSLPEACGRVTLLDLETRFKSREEGRDIIRWKLKKSLPFDVGDIHLDYQILREKENGEMSVLVAIIARQVVAQYEELLIDAGIKPNRIDFTTFNIYRIFAPRIEMSESALMASCHEGILSILIFQNGVLEFYRAKELGEGTSDMNRVFMEANSSLVFYRDKNPGKDFREVFCHTSCIDRDMFRTVMAEASGLEPFMLSTDTFVQNHLPLGGGASLAPLTAALGAATRNL